MAHQGPVFVTSRVVLLANRYPPPSPLSRHEETLHRTDRVSNNGDASSVSCGSRVRGSFAPGECGLSAIVPAVPQTLTPGELEALAARTLAHYGDRAEAFAEATRDHDVSENYAAFLGALEGPSPFRVLDLGCGPGRDLRYFRSLGHEAVGLDGCARFVQMARRDTGCEVLHQSFLDLSLEPARFTGIFANASLFHVPTQELARVLGQLRNALVPRGVLFSSNPRGTDTEGYNGERYGAFHSLSAWRTWMADAGFTEIAHYYRPAGLPRERQPWLATVWRK